jgi:hypothetical protein
MNGTAIAAASLVANVPTTWTPALVGDFDGNGKADVLWRNATTGDVSIWLMDGATIVTNGSIANVPANWVAR